MLFFVLANCGLPLLSAPPLSCGFPIKGASAIFKSRNQSCPSSGLEGCATGLACVSSMSRGQLWFCSNHLTVHAVTMPSLWLSDNTITVGFVSRKVASRLSGGPLGIRHPLGPALSSPFAGSCPCFWPGALVLVPLDPASAVASAVAVTVD